jgi:sec-independent protein translocase protein TatC
MYLLQKAIQLREKSHPDHEKPFLEHLEDLRTMIIRILVTLMFSMIACFFFNGKIMEFFRRPVDQVLATQIDLTLPRHAPRKLTSELWTQAMKVEHSTLGLSPEQRDVYYRFLRDDNLVFHAKSVGLLRAAESLPEDRRADFVASLNEAPEMKSQLKALLVSKPNTENHVRGNLTMMSALTPTEGFMLSMKLAFVAGIIVSSPLLLLFILQFVLPGMHAHERRVLWPAMSIGFGLFLTGASFAYFLILPKSLLFFYQWSSDMGISNDWRIGEYISFATKFTLLFGISFEFPVVVMICVKLGLFGYEQMARTRAYAIVGIFLVAGMLTPTPDIPTLCLMAAPMILLYEICIWLAYFDRKKKRIQEEEEARQEEERVLARKRQRAETAAAQDAVETHHSTVYDVSETPSGHDGDDGWSHEAPVDVPHDESHSDEKGD